MLLMIDFFDQKLMFRQKGQVLIEILVAIVVAGVIIGGVASTIGTSLVASKKNKQITSATGIAQQDIEAIKSLAESNWNLIYCPPAGSCPGNKTSANHYQPAYSSGTWQMQSGEATTTLDSVIYTHYFYLDNVYRNDNGDIVTSGGDEDPSTQKITAVVTWSNSPDFSLSEYMMRHTSSSFRDLNWTSGNFGIGPYTVGSGNYSTTSGDVLINSSTKVIKLNI